MEQSDKGMFLARKFYEEGKMAKVKGLILADNPYEPGTIMNVSWASGWESDEKK